MSKENILVTGATGFLGMHTVRALLQDAYRVRAFVQNGQDTKQLEALGVPYTLGDLLNKTDLDKAIQGCNIVIHAAAMTNVLPGRNAKVRAVNIDGTRNMVEIAKRHKIQRFIHIGTANSLGYGSKEHPGDESKPGNCAKYKLDYIDSKLAAQAFILAQVKDHSFPALVLNPTFMIGPGGTINGSNQLIIHVSKRNKIIYPRGGRNYVAVKDVARGIANAVSMGKIGECYILGNKNLSYKEIFGMIATNGGKSLKLFPIPPFILKSVGFMAEVIGKLSAKTPTFSYALAKMSCDEHYYSAAKAVKEITLPQTPLHDAIKEAIDWNRSQNLI